MRRFVFAAALAAFLPACNKKNASSSSPPKAPASVPAAKWTDSDLFQKTMGLSPEKLAALLGAPTARAFYDDVEIWFYKFAVLHEGGRLTNPAFHFSKGRFNMINHHEPEVMDQHISRALTRKKVLPEAEEGRRRFNPVEISALVLHRTKDEVRKALGEPDKKGTLDGKDVWTYKSLLEHEGKTWDQKLRFFGNDRVDYLWSTQSKP